MSGLLLRGALAGLALAWLQQAFGEAALGPLLPAMQRLFEHLLPDFEVLFFGLDRKGADHVVGVVAALRHYTVVGAQVLTPGPAFSGAATAVALQAWHGATLAVWVALVWPAPDALRTRLLRLALLLAPAALLVVADTPLALAGELWRSVLTRAAPGTFTPLGLLHDLLEGGGRFAAGFCLGAAAVLTASLPGLRYQLSRWRWSRPLRSGRTRSR